MTLELTPAANEPEFGDPACTGDWAAVLPALLAEPQIAPWCSYSVRRDGVLVGLGSFKGLPDHDGRVEIAYLTCRTAKGEGVARATVAKLAAIARAAGATELVAHTLPEHNGSTRVLIINGFHHAGVIDDPADGSVWRWLLGLRY